MYSVITTNLKSSTHSKFYGMKTHQNGQSGNWSPALGAGRPVGAGVRGVCAGAGGRRYVSAVAADGDARNADDLQMPSAPPPTRPHLASSHT